MIVKAESRKAFTDKDLHHSAMQATFWFILSFLKVKKNQMELSISCFLFPSITYGSKLSEMFWSIELHRVMSAIR